jgi:gluconolactonase
MVGLYAFAAASHAQDSLTPDIPGVVAAGTRIEFIKEGFQGTEGPVPLPDGSVLFTEAQANRITRIAPDGSTSPFIENTNGSSSLAYTADGRLIAAEVPMPRIAVIYPKDQAKILADNYSGKPLNRPNDLVVTRQGDVYFTDPGARAPAGQPPTPTAVYHLASTGKLTLIASDIERPNGIQLSPDERVLYVANTDGEYVLAYDIVSPGVVGPKREFARLAGFRKMETGTSSGADGLAVDSAGRLYVASTAGIQVFSPKGEALGVITLPKGAQNIAFGGPDKRTLYLVGRGAAYRIAMLSQGYAGRAK